MQVKQNDGWALVDDIEISQWTGLIDSEGREIYEGDYIEQQHIYSDLQKGVVWYRSELGNVAGWMCGGSYMSSMMESIKVIGNRWEQPELAGEG